MKKACLLLICLCLTFLPSSAKSVSDKVETNDSTPKIFIYHIPDNDVSVEESESTESNNDEETQSIISDDVTADTSGQDVEEQELEEDDFKLEEYQIDDMYNDVLQGYAVYDEETELGVFLKDDLEEYQVIKINRPVSLKGGKYAKGKYVPQLNMYSKFTNMEYSIAPISSSNSKTIGNFSAGALYNQGIDYAELESSSGIFSRYDTKYFAISTSYLKTVNSTNNNYNDNFYLSPELKINQYFTLKETLSADVSRNRKKAELVLSINPFGNKDSDRMRLELGASSVFDETNTLMKNQFKFSTKFKL